MRLLDTLRNAACEPCRPRAARIASDYACLLERVETCSKSRGTRIAAGIVCYCVCFACGALETCKTCRKCRRWHLGRGAFCNFVKKSFPSGRRIPRLFCIFLQKRLDGLIQKLYNEHVNRERRNMPQVHAIDKKQISLWLKKSVADELSRQAAELGISRAALVTLWVREQQKTKKD